MFGNVLLQTGLPLPSGIAYKTIGFEGLINEASHLKYPFLSSCNTSPRCKFRMLESPKAAVSLLVHGLTTSMKSSPSSSCNHKIQTDMYHTFPHTELVHFLTWQPYQTSETVWTPYESTSNFYSMCGIWV
jgi:hypothetical protein